MRVVLYAEGVGELGGGLPPAPGNVLPDDQQGPAHVLVRRALRQEGLAETTEIRFDSPQRTRRGVVARGSALHNETTLRQLLSWAKRALRPDFAFVLVDADGDLQRETRLLRAAEQASIPHVISAAIQEFEAWLVADHETVARLLHADLSARSAVAGNPEGMKPGESKMLLSAWFSAVAIADDHAMRMAIASECRLTTLQERCGSFAGFLRAIRSVLPSV